MYAKPIVEAASSRFSSFKKKVIFYAFTKAARSRFYLTAPS
jgi:hypothetical protein